MSKRNCKDCADPDCCLVGIDSTWGDCSYYVEKPPTRKEVKEEMDEIVRPGFEVGWKVRITKPVSPTLLRYCWNPEREGLKNKTAVAVRNSVMNNGYWILEIDGEEHPYWWSEEMLECDHQWAPGGSFASYKVCTQCGELLLPGSITDVEIHNRALSRDEIKRAYRKGIYTLDKEKDMDMIEVEAPKTVLEKKALKEAKELAIQNATATKKQEYFDAVNRFIGLERKARESRALADELKKFLGLTKAEIDELI